MSDSQDDQSKPDASGQSAESEQPSEQTAGAGANNPARPSETGGNSIEVGDAFQDLMETDPGEAT
jgi:hypothetical protein